MELLPIHIYILLHIKRANVEYAKMISKMTDLDIDEINKAIEDLMELDYLERDSGSAIKRSKARFKRAKEVHKHHTYYKLSREGELFVREIDEKYLKRYLNALLGTGGSEIIQSLFSKNVKSLNLDKDIIEKLQFYKLLSKSGKTTKFFKMFMRFAQITQ
jgi:predicted transcriptional regulator